MINGFSKQYESLREQIENHKKVFGDIIDIDSVKVRYKLDEYREFMTSLFDEFFATPRNFARLVLYPRHSSTMEVLIGKAISGVRPFFAGKIGSKSHSDAGFKDSVLAETIFEYHRTSGRLCVLITQDNDFGKEFGSKITDDGKFVLLSSVSAVINALEEYYKLNPQKYLRTEFTENNYWHEYLLNEAGITWDNSMPTPCVEDVSPLEGKIFMIRISFVVNESKYIFFVKFDSVANDIIETNYQIEEN